MMAENNSEFLCCCEYCNDGDGECIYPMYGLAPHKHQADSMMGSTVVEDEPIWPDNFCEDHEAPGLGSYNYCLHCGRPNDEGLWYKDRMTRKTMEITSNEIK